MKNRNILIIILMLLAIVLVLGAFSDMAWLNRENSQERLRKLLGLPSIAKGNLSPAARNPGLELLCTGMYDTPGGYCGYFTDGVPFINFRTGVNVTLDGDGK